MRLVWTPGSECRKAIRTGEKEATQRDETIRHGRAGSWTKLVQDGTEEQRRNVIRTGRNAVQCGQVVQTLQ